MGPGAKCIGVKMANLMIDIDCGDAEETLSRLTTAAKIAQKAIDNLATSIAELGAATGLCGIKVVEDEDAN